MTTDDATPPHGFPRPGLPALGQLTPGNGLPRPTPPRPRDDTTRYLCAAAHLDDEFADNAIRECLIEDTRPVPATPGVDAAAVLGEAVAARTRRKLRDIGLGLLMIGFLVLAPLEWVTGWIVVAFLAAIPAAVKAMKSSGKQARPSGYAMAGVIGLLLLLYLAYQLLESLTGDDPYPSGSSPSYYGELPEYTSDGVVIGAVAVVLAMLAVLTADRLVVWRHLNDRFWPNRLARIEPWLRDRGIFQYSAERQLTQLTRYAEPQDTMAPSPTGRTVGPPVPLVVYRDFVPFVGAGVPVEPWSIAVPLKAAPGADPTGELTTTSLYAGIRDEVLSLREMSVLAPGRRLAHLELGEQVIVSADELVDHIAEPVSADFLREPGVAPFTVIRRERAEAIKADPVEWARYYQRYQVETWDRDLVVSVFVHVAVGAGTLYVEWTPCVLRPVKKEYQEIDAMPRSPLRPAWRAFVDLLTLPVSLPGRVRAVFSFLRPLPQDNGMIVPAMYGSAASLRELAAADDVHSYFQLADVDRYLKMMESRLVLAVSRMVREAGYSAASFDEQAATVVNNNVHIAGSMSGNVVQARDINGGVSFRAPRPTA